MYTYKRKSQETGLVGQYLASGWFNRLTARDEDRKAGGTREGEKETGVLSGFALGVEQ